MTKDFKDIQFNISVKQHNIMIEMLYTEQMIRDKMYKDDEEKLLLTLHYKDLGDKLVKEFQKNNKAQIKEYKSIYNDMLNKESER